MILTTAAPRAARPAVRLLMAVGLVLLVVAAAMNFWPRPAPADALPAGGTYPMTAPLEWSGQARWQTPPLLRDAGRGLVIGSRDLAVVTADRHVILADAATGRVRFTAALPEGRVASELHRTRIDDVDVIAIHVGDHLAWWRTDGTAASVAVPAGSRLSFSGSSPLITIPGAGTTGIVLGGTVREFALPEGMTAWAADGAEIVAASPRGWARLRPDQGAPAIHTWQVPAGVQVTPAAYLDGALIAVTTAPGGSTGICLTRSEGTTLFPATFSPAPAQVKWSPSPSGTWGILDRTLIDVHAGTTRALGAWTTQMVSTDRALGLLDGHRVMTGPAFAQPMLLGDRESFPEDLIRTDQPGVSALLRGANTHGDEVLYLLPPAGSTH